MTDTPISLLTVPTHRCLVCSVEGERTDGGCPRCGATDADVRVLLRAGAKAYTDAREDACAGRFADARENLRLAASLGLGESAPWRELSGLVDASDPGVFAEDAKLYRHARSSALQDQFLAGQLLISPDTPSSRELMRLCKKGTALRNRATWLTAARYVAVGTACAALAFFIPLRLPSNGTLHPTVAGRTAPETVLPPLIQRTGAARLPAPIPISTPYPYPERLARRYYNDARAAYREKQYGTAAGLADLAAEIGKNTYLSPHALLLRAEIADTMGDTDAPRFWAKIANDSPTSPYAPLGLLRAVERAEKNSGGQAAVAPYLQELTDRYPLSNEARIARRRFTPPAPSGKKKEEARH